MSITAQKKKGILLLPFFILLSFSFLHSQAVDLEEAREKEEERIKKMKSEGRTSDWKVTDEELQKYQEQRKIRDRTINRDHPQPIKKKVESLKTLPRQIHRTRVFTNLDSFRRELWMAPGLVILGVLVSLFYLVVMWRVFTKAGQPGIAVLIPIYNLYVMIRIAGRPGWWLLLFLIPLVNVIIGLVIHLDIASNFGRGAFFALGLIFLGFIFWPVLAFGNSRYRSARSPS